MIRNKVKAVAAAALFLALAGSGPGYWPPAVFGGPPVGTNRAGEGKAPSPAEPAKEPAPAEEPKRLELKEAEKLVRQYIFDDNPKMNPTAEFPVKEITTAPVWKGLHVQVFQVKDGVREFETYVIKSGQVFHIGNGFGGRGVNSLGVADLNKTGRPALVYTYSWGSGTHRSHVALFDVGSKKPKEAVAPQTYFSGTNEDLSLKVVDEQTVEVSVGDQKIGRLVLEGKEEAWKLRLALDEKVPAEVRKRFQGVEREKE